MRTSPGCGKSRESLPKHLRVYGHLESWKFKGVSVCVCGGVVVQRKAMELWRQAGLK